MLGPNVLMIRGDGRRAACSRRRRDRRRRGISEVGQAFSFCLLTRRAVKINSRTDFNMKDKLNPKVTTTAIQKRFGLLSR